MHSAMVFGAGVLVGGGLVGTLGLIFNKKVTTILSTIHTRLGNIESAIKGR